MAIPHVTRPIKVWIDADVGIADFILELNEIAGIRTLASCQGTIGEGGEHPYGPHVMVAWEDDDALARISHLKMTRLGPAFGYVYPEANILPRVPPREGPLQSTTEQADASRDHPVREALEAMLAAWDSLPVGSHSARVINNWLCGDQFKLAVSGARAALSPSPTSVMPDEGKQK